MQKYISTSSDHFVNRLGRHFFSRLVLSLKCKWFFWFFRFWICRSSMPDVHLFMTVFYLWTSIWTHQYHKSEIQTKKSGYSLSFRLIQMHNFSEHPVYSAVFNTCHRLYCTCHRPYRSGGQYCRTSKPWFLDLLRSGPEKIWDVRSHIEHPTCGLEKLLKGAPSLLSRWIQYLIFVLMLEVHHKNHKKI